MKRLFLAAALGLLCHTASARDLILAVSEGSSGGTDHARVIAKYQGLANVIGQSIRMRVAVIFIREFAALDEGLAAQRFDLAMARPSDYPARAIRDHGYRYIASAKPDGQCFIIVPKDSPITNLEQAKGRRIVTPNPAAYMTKLCTADLKLNGINLESENVKRVREQGAVAFFVENNFADVGAVASYSGVAKTWESKGHRILHKSDTQPYFPLIANASLTKDQVAAIQKALQNLSSTPEGETVLKTIGLTGFDTGSEQKLSELLKFLGI